MLDQNWRKSSYSGPAGCVSVREIDGMIQVKNSKVPNGPVHRFTIEEWTAFLAGVRDGEFNV